MLKEFFAVTLTSIYHVKDSDGQYGHPSATKIALKSESKFPVGVKLKDGSMLAICQWLQMYIPEGGGITSFQRRIESVNTRYWGSGTSPIVGLFLKLEDAQNCFREKNLQPFDPRWQEKTIEVLKAIGHDHPSFEICTFPSLRLVEPERWQS